MLRWQTRLVSMLVVRLLITVAAIGMAGAAYSDENEGPAEAAAEARATTDAAPAETQRPLFERLQIHGFLTQAFADASFATGGFLSPVPDEQILGIPEDGTTDYRNAAIQFRYESSDKDIFVLQLSHRALGSSPITEVEDDIELDWAFYERRFGNGTYLKVGRIQIPIGIFNEVRDVGTLLPFFRPTFTFYREGSFSSETVDGVMVGRSFTPKNLGWTFDVDTYVGGWDLVEVDQTTGRAGVARAEDAIGFHLWANSPIPGLRLGVGGQRYNVRNGFLRPAGTKTTWSDWHVSLEALFEHWVVRAEYRDNRFLAVIPLGEVDVPLQAYYVQLGYRFTPQWRVYVQFEKADAERRSKAFVETVRLNFRRDYGLALNYALRDNVLIKLEHHLYDIDTFRVAETIFTPEGPKLRWEVRPAEDGRQTIFSLSTSF